MTTLDLETLDPAPLKAGAETDALISEWMGWEIETHDGKPPHVHPWGDRGRWRWLVDWSPSTDPAHAGEAMRKADWSSCIHVKHRVAAGVEFGGICYYGTCDYSEVTGDTEEEIKGKAQALATCRAIAAAMVKGGAHDHTPRASVD